jgi:Dolichyl-phosphate-mannose-protein mannosyltransferase
MFAALKKVSSPWLGGVGICVLLVALRWNSLDAPLVRDEGEYAYAAQLLGRGLLPYEHSFLQKPPMVVYTFALSGALAPNVFWFPRVLAGLFAVLATCLLGLIARLEFGPGIALPTMWLVTPLLLFPGLWQFAANTEAFMLVPLLGTIAVYVVSRHRRGGPAAWFWAGLLGTITVWYKYTALPVLALLFAVWSFEDWRDYARADRRLPAPAPGLRTLGFELWTLHRWLFGLLGAIVASGAILAPFLARDGGKRLRECTVTFNRYYAEAAGFGAAALWSTLQLFLEDWWILFLLPVILVVSRRRRVWFWISMFLAAWVSTGASSHGHYYLVVMPFWALLAAVAIDEFAALGAAKLKWPHDGLRRAFTAVVLVLLCLPDLPWVVCSKQQFAAVKAGGGNAFIESRAVARRVAELTSPDDYVFVAGSEPQILCYSKRLSPTRFVIAYPLMLPTPLAEGYQREAMHELERHPAKVIVLARSGTSWLRQERSPPAFLEYLEKLLADRYERVGGWVVDESNGRWQEPLSNQDLANSSLVLFRQRSL